MSKFKIGDKVKFVDDLERFHCFVKEDNKYRGKITKIVDTFKGEHNVTLYLTDLSEKYFPDFYFEAGNYEEILIKIHNKNLIPPEPIVVGDLIDLRAAETVQMKKGEFRYINLGISMKLPKGYEAHVYPRSSTFKNFHLIQTNSTGIIDNSYCGNNDIWYFPCYATEDTTVNLNDRICQFRIVKKQPQIKFTIVDELNDPDRGGLGSTGIK